MRLYLLIPLLSQYGGLGEKSSFWLFAQELVKQGLQVTLLCGRSRLGVDEFEKNGIRVLFLTRTENLEEFQKACEKYLDTIDFSKPTIIHFFEVLPINFALKHRKNKMIRFVADVGALKLEGLFRILNRSTDSARSHLTTLLHSFFYFFKNYFTHDRDILKLSDAVVVSSPEQKFFLERYYIYPDSRIYLIPQALGEEQYDGQVELAMDEYIGRTPFITGEPALFLVFSDMIDLPEVSSVLEAFEKVAIRKNNCFLFIIGNGPKFKEIEFDLLNRALGNRAFLIGERSLDEVLVWIQNSDLIIDLSPIFRRSELYLAHALKFGKIIVASEFGSMAHVIEDGVDGFLVRPSSSDDLALIMMDLLEGKLKIDEISSHAKLKAEKVFSPGKIGEAVITMYNSVLSRKPRV